jgi:hypothetical protein
MLPYFLDIRLTDGVGVVSLTRRSSFTFHEDSWYSFMLEAEKTPEPQCDWKDYASGKIKRITSSEIETATFRLVA